MLCFMNEIDWVILAVLAISTVLGVSRGVVREILAIVGWVLGIVLSLKFAPAVAEMIPLPSVSILIRTAFGAVLIVVVTLFVIGMLGRIFSSILRAASISFEDRAIGAVFGLARGVVIVCACVFVLGLTSVTKTSYWRNSVLIVPAERVIDFSLPYLPHTIAQMRTNRTFSF